MRQSPPLDVDALLSLAPPPPPEVVQASRASSKHLVEAPAAAVTPATDWTLDDLSLLLSAPSVSSVTSTTTSTLVPTTASTTSSSGGEAATAPATKTQALELKRWYHTQSLTLIREADEARRELDASRARTTELETKVRSMSDERQRHVRVLSECKGAMKRAREELDQTRASYDEQLRLLSSRVVELEESLRAATAEADRLREENALLAQLKASRFFASSSSS